LFKTLSREEKMIYYTDFAEWLRDLVNRAGNPSLQTCYREASGKYWDSREDNNFIRLITTEKNYSGHGFWRESFLRVKNRKEAERVIKDWKNTAYSFVKNTHVTQTCFKITRQKTPW